MAASLPPKPVSPDVTGRGVSHGDGPLRAVKEGETAQTRELEQEECAGSVEIARSRPPLRAEPGEMNLQAAMLGELQELRH
eukprot:104158-Rhodomonas_salina.1